MLWPARQGLGTYALGVPEGEGPAHLWGLTTAAEGLGRFGPFVRDSMLVAFPDGVHLDLVDPFHLVFITPGVWLAGITGATVGWNLMHLTHLLILALGAWMLARQVDPTSRMLAAVATAGAISTPYLWSGVALGRSELLGMTLLPLLLALFLGAARAVSPWPARAAGALVLASLAACGWQPLLQGAMVGIPASLVLGRQVGLDLRKAAVSAAWIVLPAALLTVPMLISHLGEAPWWMARAAGIDALGEGAPSVDLRAALRLFEVRPRMSMTVAPYPGWVVLALLGLGLARGPRRTAVLGVFLLFLIVGPRYNLGDPNLRYFGPAFPIAWLIPIFGGLNDWGRLALAAGPFLALAGATALAPWLRGSRGILIAVVAVSALMVDGLSFRLEAPQAFRVPPSDEVSRRYSFLPDGPVLELPGVSPSEATSITGNDLSMLWSLSHRRPVQATPSPFGSPMLRRSMLLRLHDPNIPRRVDICQTTESGRLFEIGYRSVVLHHDRLKAMTLDEMLLRLLPALGKPTGRDHLLSYWSLKPGPLGPANCAPPPLATTGSQDAGQNSYGSPPPSLRAAPSSK